MGAPRPPRTSTPDTPRRPTILLVAEAVTLAHVARVSVLAQALDAGAYDVHAAWDPRYRKALGEMPFRHHPIWSLPTADFLARLARGRPMHDEATLERYVEEDLDVIGRVKPDVIVGDFRLSLVVSARLAGIPLVTLANAYWSPWGRQTFQFPEYDYPLADIVGGGVARQLFRVFRSIGFATHTRPLNAVLRSRGLPAIGGDIRAMYTAGDVTAYCDIPELVPIEGLPASHRYLGPVLWSPAVALPEWWAEVPDNRPVIYVTPGSSGETDWLPLVFEALADLPVTVIGATAGRLVLPRIPENARAADFLPGMDAAARASLVICNGGSPTTSQALAAGVPVLGIVSNNMDQHLNMEAVRKAGAGMVLRARGLSAAQVREAVSRSLETPSYREAARALSTARHGADAQQRFAALMAEMVSQGSSSAAEAPLSRVA